jgi:DNA-binding beta-propeller fold protein YncE
MVVRSPALDRHLRHLRPLNRTGVFAFHREGDIGQRKAAMILKMVSLLCALALCVMAPAAPAPYHLVGRMQPGGEGGWDYLTVDSAARRLYLSRGAHVMVVDLQTLKLVGDLADTPGVHGIAVAPELNRGFTSNGRANTASIFDLRTLKVLGQVKTGSNPDAIVYDPDSRRVFTFNGQSKDATVFSALTGQVLATIPLGGKPEFAAPSGRGQVYVNNEDTAEVIEIDSRHLVVTKRWSIKPGESPTGLAFDGKHHRVFSVCGNRLMSVLNTKTGTVTTVPIGQGADGAGYDAGRGLAFSSNGEGTLTIVREVSAGRFEVAQTLPTLRGARTMAVDSKTHRIYLPTALFGPTPAATAETPRPRPTTLKDSFVVLIVGN